MVAAQYIEALRDCSGLELPTDNSEHTWQSFMVLPSENFDCAAIIRHLGQQDIEAGPGSVAAHLGAHFQPQPALPISERLHHRGIALPLHAALSGDQVAFVAESLRQELNGSSSPLTSRDELSHASHKSL